MSADWQAVIDDLVRNNPHATSSELEALFMFHWGDGSKHMRDTFRALVRWPPDEARPTQFVSARRQARTSLDDDDGEDDAEPDQPSELPDVRDRGLPYDDDADGVAGYLPELRDRGVRHEPEDEDEDGL